MTRPKRRRWWRWVLAGLLGMVGLAAVVGLTIREFTRHAGQVDLAAVEAELDASDPGWRLEDVLAKRDAALPSADKNSAMVAMTAYAKIPAGWKDWNDRGTGLNAPRGDDPPVLPDPADVADAKRMIDTAADALADARRLKDLPTGGSRYAPDLDGSILHTDLPDLQPRRMVAALLVTDAKLAAHAGDLPRAVADAHAVVNVARSVGDEPTAISILVRRAIAAMAVRSAEQLLAWGEPDAGLAGLQAAFLAEADEPLYEVCCRAERASFHRMIGNCGRSRATMSRLLSDNKSDDKIGPLDYWMYRTVQPGDLAFGLRVFNAAVIDAQTPPHLRTTDLAAMLQPKTYKHTLSYHLFPALNKVANADVRITAMLRAAAVGVACERHRRKAGAWPAKLADIPRDIMPAVPVDPYSGDPLRYARTDDGVVVYGTGPDRTDDDGLVFGDGSEVPGADVGFRLYDVAKRRQPPEPKAIEEPQQ